VDNPAFNYLSVCTGGGGLDLGLRQAVPNAVCRGYVEIEAAAIALLVAHIENGSLDEAPVYNDLRRFNGRRYRGRLDGIVGGYPCQPFSFAGRRRGTDDPRHLWPYIYRLVCESEPRWCFFENVSGHLGTGYHDVVKPNLEGAGYRVAEGIFTAEEVGAPHRRERLFILAGRSGAELADAFNAGGWNRPNRRADGTGEARLLSGERQACAGEPKPSGAELGDAKSEPIGGQQRRGMDAGTEANQKWQTHHHELDGSNPVMGHTHGEHDNWPRYSGQERGAELANGGAELGDANRQGLQGRRPKRERTDELPAWPPSPSNTDVWARVLAVRPDLAPALATEPGVRGVADGVAGGLGRRDKLAVLGNGVVPAQAAFAFATLAKRFM